MIEGAAIAPGDGTKLVENCRELLYSSKVNGRPFGVGNTSRQTKRESGEEGFKLGQPPTNPYPCFFCHTSHFSPGST